MYQDIDAGYKVGHIRCPTHPLQAAVTLAKIPTK